MSFRVGHEPADRRRRGHELREAAVDLQAERPISGAKVCPPAETPRAPPARDAGTRHDAIAHPHVGDIVCDCRDAPDKLVAEHDSRRTEDRAVVPFRRIGAADRGTEHLYDHLACSGIRPIGDALDPNVSRTVENRCLHTLSTRSAP